MKTFPMPKTSSPKPSSNHPYMDFCKRMRATAEWKRNFANKPVVIQGAELGRRYRNVAHNHPRYREKYKVIQGAELGRRYRADRAGSKVRVRSIHDFLSLLGPMFIDDEILKTFWDDQFILYSMNKKIAPEGRLAGTLFGGMKWKEGHTNIPITENTALIYFFVQVVPILRKRVDGVRKRGGKDTLKPILKPTFEMDEALLEAAEKCEVEYVNPPLMSFSNDEDNETKVKLLEKYISDLKTILEFPDENLKHLNTQLARINQS